MGSTIKYIDKMALSGVTPSVHLWTHQKEVGRQKCDT
jgi:hypothetical protein